MKNYIYIFLVVLVAIYSFTKIDNEWFISPKGFPQPIYDFKNNTLSQEKINLGRALFYDPILSKNNTISCSSCHLQYTAFTHVDHTVSHGIDDRIGTRNAPALMNLAWHSSFMWDGAINHLDMQSLLPISHPDEMGETIEHVVDKMQKTSYYPKLYYDAFADSTITGEHTLKALASFMVTLISNNSKYDSVMRRESIFNDQQANGYALFKKKCSICHSEPLFTNMKFENNGLSYDTFYKDNGRMKITQLTDDSLKFKVPSLRNIEFSYPYMHDGRFKKLSEVLNHYNTGVVHYKNTSVFLNDSMGLSSNEKVDIIAFLLTLTDKTFLFHKKYSYPRNLYK
jgi:cytochrome c peroxidase